MKTKRIFSVILAAAVGLMSLCMVSAESKAATVNISSDVFSVTVTVSTEAEGQMNLQMFHEDHSQVVAVRQNKTFETDENGKHIYTFHIKMQKTFPSGTYMVRVGNNIAVEEGQFEFYNPYDVVEFYNDLDVATAEDDGIFQLLTGENYRSAYDLTAYKGLSASVRMLVDAEVEQTDLATTMETVNEKEKAFRACMDSAVPRAILADTKSESHVWQKTVSDMVNAKQLDNTYFSKVTPAGLEKAFREENVKSIQAEEISDAFDRAVMMTVLDEQDYLSVGSAIAYHVQKGILSVDEEAYQKIQKANLGNTLAKEIKNNEESISDIEDLEEEIDTTMEKLLAEDEEEEPPRGSSSGGGGGGGTGSAAKNPLPGKGAMASGDIDNAKKEPVHHEVQFADMKDAAWAEEAVTELAKKGVVSGRGDGNFYPNDVMTREEFVKLLVSAVGVYDEKATCSFSDVAEDRWSCSYIASAVAMGLVNGISETEFLPGGKMTREDMAVMIHRAYRLIGLPEDAYALDFADTDRISDYAKQSVGLLTGKGLISGMGDGSFAPKAQVTRGQAAKLVYGLLQMAGGEIG